MSKKFNRFCSVALTVIMSLGVTANSAYASGNWEEKILEKGLEQKQLDLYRNLYPNAQAAKERIKDAVTLFVGNSNAFIKGEKTQIDTENNEVKPVVENDRTLVPVRFIAESMDAKVDFENVTKTVNISTNDKTIRMVLGSDKMTVNEEEVVLDTPAQIIQDRTMIPLRAMAEAIGKKVFWDDRGLIVISDKESIVDPNTDKQFINEIVGLIIYDRPTAEKIINDVKTFNPNNQHPRIMATQDTFLRIRENLKTDPYMKKWFENTKARAETLLAKPVPETSPTESNWSYGRDTTEELIVLGMMYQITGEEKYAKRAVDEILWACNMGSWHPSHYLDVGEMSVGIAIGYDWFYHYMTEEQRKIVVKAIVEKSLTPTLEVYKRYTNDWSVCNYNWNVVCNGGVGTAALAVIDEEQASEMAGEVLQHGLRGLEYMLTEYAPDGGWHEGVTYWGYTDEFLVYWMSALDTAAGTDYGCLYNVPGMNKTGYFPFYMEGPQGIFNISDADLGVMNHPMLFWRADKMNEPMLAKLKLKMMDLKNLKGEAKDMLWYNPEKTNALDIDTPALDRYFRHAEIASFRSQWEDLSSLYVAMHGGANNSTHGQLDAGTFVVDALGERWILDVGKEDYNLPGFWDGNENGSRWKYYYNRGEGHNTVILNPGTSADQRSNAYVQKIAYESKEQGAFTVLDMTSAHASNVTDAKRGLMLTNNRSMVIVQDEVKMNASPDFWWFMHTKADVQISDDRKSAILSQNGKRVLVKMLSPSPENAVFRVMDATPLPSSLNPDGQHSTVGIKKLTVYLRGLNEVNLAVALIPLREGEEAPSKLPQFTPLSNWSIPDGPLQLKQYPVLKNITVNGEELSGFIPKKYDYDLKLNGDTEAVKVDAIAQGNEKVEITEDPNAKGVVKVKVTDEKNSSLVSIYTLKYTILPKVGAPLSSAQFKIVSLKASSVPQTENGVENAIDNNFNTRWSAEGENEWLLCALDEVKKINAVTVAFHSGDKRSTIFDIEVSADGTNWKTVFSGKSSGLTVEDERYTFDEVSAKFVRLSCHGNTASSKWNSVTEVRVYGKE